MQPQLLLPLAPGEKRPRCLSFFDVRSPVPRPLTITVQSTTLGGSTQSTVYEYGLARLVHHEIDLLDLSHMRAGVQPLPVDEYRQTGRAWSYEA